MLDPNDIRSFLYEKDLPCTAAWVKGKLRLVFLSRWNVGGGALRVEAFINANSSGGYDVKIIPIMDIGNKSVPLHQVIERNPGSGLDLYLSISYDTLRDEDIGSHIWGVIYSKYIPTAMALNIGIDRKEIRYIGGGE